MSQTMEYLQLRNGDLERELYATRQKVGELQTAGQGGHARNGSDSDAWIQSLKMKLKCAVCAEGNKSVCITKCGHLFCRSCVQRNLAARNRKCPTCHKPFGENDVMEVFF